MPCYHPLHGYRSRHVGASGKRAIVFSAREGFVDLPVSVPCGQCIGCRLERSRQWAIRCMHEASMHELNCFVTLTYDDEFLPVGGSLDKMAFPKFMKRLRKRFNVKVRYYHCGEYGDLSGRPHYHACLFGFDFPDKVLWTTRGAFPVFRSVALESLWPFGRAEIGCVTFESAAYVARYIVKKVTGSDAAEHYSSVRMDTGEVVSREPEYTTMSRRPGIGKSWYDKFACEVYPSDGVVVRGKLMKPPRFYDLALENSNPAVFAGVVRGRRKRRVLEDETPARLEVRETVARAQLALRERSL